MHNIINLHVKGNLFRCISMRGMIINYIRAGHFIRKYITNNIIF